MGSSFPPSRLQLPPSASTFQRSIDLPLLGEPRKSLFLSSPKPTLPATRPRPSPPENYDACEARQQGFLRLNARPWRALDGFCDHPSFFLFLRLREKPGAMTNFSATLCLASMEARHPRLGPSPPLSLLAPATTPNIINRERGPFFFATIYHLPFPPPQKRTLSDFFP